MATLRLRQTDHDASRRLESDADVLHFPEGGVFGKPRANRDANTPSEAHRPLRITHEAEDAFDTVQRRLDDLRRLLDEPGDDPWRPSAA